MFEAIVVSGAGGVLCNILGVGGAIGLAEFSQFLVSITPWSITVTFCLQP